MTKEQDIWNNFLESIKSPATRGQYENIVRNYIKEVGLKSARQLLTQPKDKRHQTMINYVVSMRKKGRTAHTASVHLSALWHLFTYNDVTDTNWTRVRGFIGEHIKHQDKARNIEEIRKLLLMADLRGKAMITHFASTGMRLGAVGQSEQNPTPLTIGDRERISSLNLSRFIVYRGTSAQYEVYNTPEADQYLEAYLEYRTRAGEQLHSKSPLFREHFDINDKEQVNNPRFLNRETIAAWMRNLQIKTGVRIPTKDKQKRQDVMLMHGFRKFFNTQMIHSEVNPLIKEMLMGHKTIGLEANYYKPTQQDVLKQYVKAIDNLTILTENKLLIENKELAKRVSVDSMWMDKIKSLEQRFDQLKNADTNRPL